MSHRRVAWQDGEERVQRWVDRWLDGSIDFWEKGRGEGRGAGTLHSELLVKNSRRILHRLDSSQELAIDPTGNAAMRALIVKIHLTHTGPHRQREAIKRRMGFSPALREWQALGELHAAGVPVPERLAWGILPSGDHLLVTEYLEGRELTSHLLERDVPDQLEWIERLSACVELLHSTGFRHGDLHLGNLYVRGDQVMILDLQRARRAMNRGEQLRDLAHLDFSIARLDFDPSLRRRLRERFDRPAHLDRVSRSFVRDFMRGRSRREFRIGRAWEHWPEANQRGLTPIQGLRERETPASELDRALEAARNDPSPGDRRGGAVRITSHVVHARSLILKRSVALTPRRRLMDRLLGSSAQRGFRNGQRLALLGEIGARPLATVEERSPGEAPKSWLILENVGRCDLDAYHPRSEAEARKCAVAVAEWMAEWHAWGIDHRDMKGSNVRVDDSGGSFRFWLVDLEDIRFRRRLRDASRLRALVQLNASLGDDHFDIEARKAALAAYLDRLPFDREPRHGIVASIVRRSLARKHRWRAEACRTADPGSASSANVPRSGSGGARAGADQACVRNPW